MASLQLVWDLIARDAASPALARVATSADAAAASTEAATVALDGASVAGERAALSFGGLGKVIAAIGVVDLAKNMVESASKFQSQMLLIQTQAGATSENIQDLSNKVLAMSGQVAQSPEALATSLYHVESVGLRSAQALDVVRIAAEGAKVGHADLEETTNALTAAVASGIPGIEDMSQAMGALNTIVGSGDMKMSDLNEAMGSGVLAIVKEYGLSLTDVGAALATFGDNNIRGADAATDLRMAVQALAVPAKQGKDTLDKLGLSSTQLGKDMQEGGLNQAIKDLRQHLIDAGVSGNEMGSILTDAFGKKAGPGLSVLMGQLDRLQTKYEDIDAGAGTFGSAWEKTTHTASFAFDSLRSSIDALGVSLGEKLLPVITPVVDKVAALFSAIAGSHTAIDAIEAAGAALLGLAAAWGVFSAVAMINPMTLLVGGIAALAAGLVVAYEKVKPFRDAVQQLSTVFKVFIDAFKAGDTEGGISGFFQGVGAGIEAAWPVITGALSQLGSALWAWVEPQIMPTLEKLGGWYLSAEQWILTTALPELGQAMAKLGVKLYDWIQPADALRHLGTWIVAAGTWLVGPGATELNAAVQRLGGVLIGWIGDHIGPALIALGKFSLAMTEWILGTGLPMLWDKVNQLGAALIGWIAPRLPGLLGEFGHLFGEMVGWILTTGLPALVVGLVVLSYELIKWVLPRLPELLANLLIFMAKVVEWIATTGLTMLVKAFWDLATGMLGGFFDAVSQSPIFQKVSDFFGRMRDDVATIIGDMVQKIGAIWGGIESTLATPINWVIQYVYTDGIEKIWNTVATKLGAGAMPDVPQLHFATGGVVPGNHSRDDVPIYATPGELVVPKDVVNRFGGGGRLMRMLGFPGGGGAGGHYGLGGLISDITGAVGAGWDALKSAARGGLAAVARPLVHGFESLADSSLSGRWGSLGDLLDSGVHTLGDDLINWIAGKDTTAAAPSPGGGAEQWRGAVDQVLGMLGLSAGLDNGVLQIIAHESGGNPAAINLTDSNAAAGHPSQGLMQTIPSTFETWRSPSLPDDITNPLSNIFAGVNYALHRYGASMLAAGGNHDAAGNYVGYELGTSYVPVTGPAILHKGEAVLTKNENAQRGLTGTALVDEVKALRRDMQVLSAQHAQFVVAGYKSSVDDQVRIVQMGGSRRPQ